MKRKRERDRMQFYATLETEKWEKGFKKNRSRAKLWSPPVTSLNVFLSMLRIGIVLMLIMI